MNPTYEEYRMDVSCFLKEVVIKNYSSLSKSRTHLKQMWNEAGAAGLFKGAGNIEFGGFGDRQYSLIVMEELGKHLLLDIPFWLQADVILHFVQQYGSSLQKHKYLQPLINGDKIGAFCLTEEHGGSDINLIRAKATPAEQGYVLTGVKKFITSASIADFFLVVARLEEKGENGLAIFLLERDREGITVAPIENRRAMQALDLGEVHFNKIQVTREDLLGGLRHASLAILRGLSVERFANAVLCQEMCEVLMREGVEWARKRNNGRESIMSFQFVSYSFAEHEANSRLTAAFVDTLKQLYLKEKRLQHQDVAIAKYKSISHLIQISTFLAKLFGARTVTGDITNLDILRVHNDAVAQSIAGGTEEIMKKIISEGFSYSS